ncbi:MAG: glutamate synthase subunit beta [Gammaproteobacteria bacterium]
MSENHPDGFLKYPRQPIGYRDPRERIGDYREVYQPRWEEQQLREQGQRCMDCGTPTCMAGCPIGNIIPDWNDLVYRGHWREALERLHATNNFPEFTGYTCPAPCEPACVLAYNHQPVTIKSIERAIVDRGWEQGWILPQPPKKRTGYKVAIVGSGPAGLAAAQQLNRAGHWVTVFERDDAIGGLMTYGIPDFKFSKHQVARRVEQLRKERIVFRINVEVGRDIPLQRLRNAFDAVCLAIGALEERDVSLPGRELDGIVYAMDYLVAENRRQVSRPIKRVVHACGKNVVVLGGGDTGADCVATAHRQGARQVVQISINPKPPLERPEDNPWPEWPQTYMKSYAQEEGGVEEFSVNTTAVIDEDGDGHVDYISAERVEWNYDRQGRRIDQRVLVPDLKIPADLVIIAIGFWGPQLAPFKDSDLETTERNTIKTDQNMMTNLPGVFAAGDVNRGQSIVVWAIGEGRDVARHIDLFLTGSSRLSPSLRTPNSPIGL